MLGISSTELVLILFFGFLIFGPEKLPQMGRTVGRAIKQFRTASDDVNKKFREEVVAPMQETLDPYKEKVKADGSDLKEDITAIKSGFNETAEALKDPFGLKTEFEQTAESLKDPLGIKTSFEETKELFSDPLGLKADEKAKAEAAAAAQADPKTVPLPEQGTKVKAGLAASLYGLDTASASPQPSQDAQPETCAMPSTKEDGDA